MFSRRQTNDPDAGQGLEKTHTVVDEAKSLESNITLE